MLSSLTAPADDSQRAQSLSPKDEAPKNLAYSNLAALNDDAATGDENNPARRTVSKPQSKI